MSGNINLRMSTVLDRGTDVQLRIAQFYFGARDIELRADLANQTNASLNAGLVGFSPALSYAVGTVGKFLTGLATLVTTDLLATKKINAVKSLAALPAGGDYGVSFTGDATAYEIYEGAIGPGAVPLPVIDGIASAVRSPPVTDVLSTNAVAGYVQNRTPQNFATGFQGAVGLFGVGISDADNTSTWGLATIVSDKTNQAVSTGINRFCFNEMDFNICSPDTTVSGLIIGGTWKSQPKSATGVTIFKPAGGIGKWQYAFGTQDGAATNALRVGSDLATGNNVNSQTIDMYWTGPTGVKKFTELLATNSGMILISNEAPSGTRTPGSLILNNGALYANGIVAPNNPGAGQYVLYTDSADGKLKCKSPSGLVTILGN